MAVMSDTEHEKGSALSLDPPTCPADRTHRGTNTTSGVNNLQKRD